jgi:outer membrane protein TolC
MPARVHPAMMGKSLTTQTLLLAAVIMMAAPEEARAQASRLTLQQAVAEALVKNDRILDDADASVQAGLDLRLARSEFRPKVVPNVFGSFGQTDVASQHYGVDVTQRLMTGTEMRLSLGTATSQVPNPAGGGDVRFYNADTTLLLTQPLLRGFGTTVTRRALSSAEFRQHESERRRENVRREVAIDVVSAYYQLVAQDAFLAVARLSVTRGQALHEAAEAKLAAGLVSQLDVLRARQLRSDAESQLANAVAGRDEAQDALLVAMGREPGEAVTLDADIPRVGGIIDPEMAVATALAARTELQTLVEATAESTARLAVSRNLRLPQFDLNVAMTRRNTATGFRDSFGFDKFQLATFFTVGMPVDRTAQSVDFQRALIERERRDRERVTLTRRISADVRRALRERDRLVRAVAAAETSVDLSRQEVEVAQLRYDRGLSNNLDLVAAEGQLLAAEGRRIAALAQSAVHELRLKLIMGVLDPLADVASAPQMTRNGTP